VSLLDELLSEKNLTKEDYDRAKAKTEVSGRPFMPKNGVSNSRELKRILALPRRTWEDRGDELAELLTEHLRAPGGTQKLRPVQAAALQEMHDFGGFFGPIRVGGGKTAVSMLAFVVLEAKSPVLVVPAKLVEKTRREMAQLRKHWLVPAYVRILSYEILGREQGANFLAESNPDVLVMDECHRVRNTRAAVTRRVKHFLAENEKAAERGETVRTRVVAMSGTVTKRSMHDYAHITAWCLKKTNPVPEDFNTRMEWSLILDERRNETEKIAPGALINLCNDDEREAFKIDPIVTIRRAFRRRLVETPGVVATQEGELGTSLSITSQTLIAPELATHFFSLKKKWERPDGEPIMDALEMWRHLRALAACGMFYRWNPAPPVEWLTQRKAWARSVRTVLQRGIPGLDSESPIVTAMDRHTAQMSAPDSDPEWKSPFTDEYILPMLEELRKWREIRTTFKPETEAVWLSEVQLKAAAKWMSEEKGICWVEHIEFGRKLSELTGVPYYWRGGVNAQGKPIEDHPPGTPLIASIASNSEGRNLQAWSTNYITSCPTTGAAFEQLAGRTHRDGQEADEVSIIIPIMIKEQVVQYEGALRDAKYISQTTGQEQKLCYADTDFVTVQEAPEGY